jgi:hypothetical protein
MNPQSFAREEKGKENFIPIRLYSPPLPYISFRTLLRFDSRFDQGEEQSSSGQEKTPSHQFQKV